MKHLLGLQHMIQGQRPHSSILTLKEKVTNHNHDFQNLFQDISGIHAEDSGAVSEFATDKTSCDLKYAICGPECENMDRPDFQEVGTRHFPAMSDADSVSSEPSKNNFRRFWYSA